MNDKCKNCTRAPVDLNDEYCRICLAPKDDLPFWIRKDEGNERKRLPKKKWKKEKEEEE